MISNNANQNSLKEIRKREKEEKESKLRELCEQVATSRVGSKEALISLSNKHQGLWYLPALNEDESIDKLLILKPIDRNILSYASTKITDDGLYAFLESAMRECTIKEYSDMDMLDDDEYFISAANSFNKVMEGKKTSILKR